MLTVELLFVIVTMCKDQIHGNVHECVDQVSECLMRKVEQGKSKIYWSDPRGNWLLVCIHERRERVQHNNSE